MTIEEIKNKLAKKAVEFAAGGFMPTNSDKECWIGKVYLYGEEEDIPIDEDGVTMFPLFQLCLADLPFVPDILCGTKYITMFLSSKEFPVGLCENGNNWLLREYSYKENICTKYLTNPASYIKPFPLSYKVINEDYPVWDGGGVPEDIAVEILNAEKEGVIENYYDIVENHYSHKLGGYPTFCQPGIEFGEGFEFVLQISSDNKAHLNVVDSGTIFLAKNSGTNEWRFYCDFF